MLLTVCVPASVRLYLNKYALAAEPACVLQFARLYPLGQRDLPIEKKHVDFGPLMPRDTKIINPSRDYTPPSKLPFTHPLFYRSSSCFSPL